MRLKSMFLPTAVVMLHVTFFVGCGDSSTSNGDNVGSGPPVSPPPPEYYNGGGASNVYPPPPPPPEPSKPKEVGPTTPDGKIRIS